MSRGWRTKVQANEVYEALQAGDFVDVAGYFLGGFGHTVEHIVDAAGKIVVCGAFIEAKVHDGTLRVLDTEHL